MNLHPDAAVRVIRNEIARLHEATEAYARNLDDRRLPRGFAVDQLEQIDREHCELLTALAILEAAYAAGQEQLPFDYEDVGRAEMAAA